MVDAEKTIPVAEIFGPTLQGEGALAGIPTYFLRVGGCDFKCLWCDSGHAVNPEEVRKLERFTPEDISQVLSQYAAAKPGPRWLTISGGNPGLYDLSDVVVQWQHGTRLLDVGRGSVAVETQGTKWQDWFADVNLLTISPKPPSSGMASAAIHPFLDFVRAADEVNRDSDRSWPYNDWRRVLKVVVFDETDYLFAQNLHNMYPLIPFYLSCGTAMGGLDGKWVPPAIPDLDTESTMGMEIDKFASQRQHPEINWSAPAYIDSTYTLLRRYRWLADRMKSDPTMADVAALPQLHALTWGITTRGT